MTTSLSHHDHVFKKFLGDIAVSRDFLEIHFPPHLRKRCDFSTLAITSGSFIDDDLKGQCSDMLYAMKTTTGHDGYVYCLIEHQSRPEKLMAFRLMRYAVAAMQLHLEQGQRDPAGGDTTAVLPRHHVAVSVQYKMAGLLRRAALLNNR